MIKLTLTEKGGEPKVLTFDKDEITIGRVSGNDIVLAKGNISKRHTRLTKREGGMEIADLKSTNGTYVNGRKIAGPTAVAPSDRIYVGDFLSASTGRARPSPSRAACTARRAASASTTSASRRLPVPPPPPPPARGGSSASRLPDEETRRAERKRKTSSSPRARRARAGRSAATAAAAPARRPTPMASASLGLDEEEELLPTARPSTCPNRARPGQCRPVPAHAPWHGRRRRRRPRRVGTGNRPEWGPPRPPQAPAFGGATGPVATPGPMRACRRAPGLETLLADPAATQS